MLTKAQERGYLKHTIEFRITGLKAGVLWNLGKTLKTHRSSQIPVCLCFSVSCAFEIISFSLLKLPRHTEIRATGICSASSCLWLFCHQRGTRFLPVGLVSPNDLPWINCHPHINQPWMMVRLTCDSRCSTGFSLGSASLTVVSDGLLQWLIISHPSVLISNIISSKNPNYKLLSCISLIHNTY